MPNKRTADATAATVCPNASRNRRLGLFVVLGIIHAPWKCDSLVGTVGVQIASQLLCLVGGCRFCFIIFILLRLSADWPRGCRFVCVLGWLVPFGRHPGNAVMVVGWRQLYLHYPRGFAVC